MAPSPCQSVASSPMPSLVMILALAQYWAVTSAPALSWAAPCLQGTFGSGPHSGGYCSSGCYFGSDVGFGSFSDYGFGSSPSWVMTLALALPQAATASLVYSWAVIFLLQSLFGPLLWRNRQLRFGLWPLLGLQFWLWPYLEPQLRLQPHTELQCCAIPELVSNFSSNPILRRAFRSGPCLDHDI